MVRCFFLFSLSFSSPCLFPIKWLTNGMPTCVGDCRLDSGCSGGGAPVFEREKISENEAGTAPVGDVRCSVKLRGMGKRVPLHFKGSG